MSEKYKLVEKHEHLYTDRRWPEYGFTDWYILKCGHVVSRINTDARRTKCRCYYCAGKTYRNTTPIPAWDILRKIWDSGKVPIIDNTDNPETE